MTRRELLTTAILEAADNKPQTLLGLIDTLLQTNNVKRLAEFCNRVLNVREDIAEKTIKDYVVQ